VLGLIVAWAKTPADVKEMLTPILFAGMPAFLFGVAEDITKRVAVVVGVHFIKGRALCPGFRRRSVPQL